MTRSEVFFRLIDIIADPFQNYKQFKNVEKRKENVVYDDAYPKDCVAEIYYPKGSIGEDKPKLPVVVNVHGGGFVKGDMHFRRSVSKRFADQGYFVVNMDHRLAPKYSMPAGLVDCVNALNYLEVLATEYNIDLNKVCVTGDSSGAYYAAQMVCLATNPALVEKIGAPAVRVKPTFFVGFCGPYDLEKTISYVKLPFGLLWDIGRCIFDQGDFHLKKDYSNMNDAPYLYETNVLHWVNADWCPTFLAISKKDFICKGHGEALKQKLDEAGVENRSYSSTKFVDNHCYHLNSWAKAAKETFRDVFAFMDERFR